MTTKHGGRREGAGRKRIMQERVIISMSLDARQLRLLDRWRKGRTRSAAIRDAITQAMKGKQGC